MKKVRIGAITVAAAIMASSCTTSYQASSGMTGAWLGGEIGEAVGFLTGGHFRGHNAALGRLIGMGAGAALGVGIASQVEKNERQAYNAPRAGHREDTRSAYGSGADRVGDYQTGGGAYSDITSDAHDAPVSGNLTISDLSYTDANGDGYISKDEVCEIEAYVTNNTSSTINDVQISLSSANVKDFALSPSLTTALSPGQRVRYTGRVICKKARRADRLIVTMSVSTNTTMLSSKSMSIPVR